MVYFSKMTEKGEYRMNFFMGKKFVGPGGGKKDQGPEVVFDNGEESNKRMKRMLRPIKIAIAVAVLAIAAFDSFYTLSENEMAVLTTFGRPSSVTTSGPKFKVPFIQKVHKMSKEIKGMPIGYDPDYNAQNHADSENNPITVSSESEMITKDFNFVNVDFYIEYQIVDPIKAYIHSDTAIPILKNLAQSYIRDTVGSYSVDEVITTGKSEIQAKVKALLSERLEQEDIGLGINNVTIQDAQPPTDAVNNAFKAVEDAKQGMDTKINEARKYQSERLSLIAPGRGPPPQPMQRRTRLQGTRKPTASRESARQRGRYPGSTICTRNMQSILLSQRRGCSMRPWRISFQGLRSS